MVATAIPLDQVLNLVSDTLVSNYRFHPAG